MTVHIIPGGVNPAQQERRVPHLKRRWIIGNKEVCLIKKDKKLAYTALDYITGQFLEGPINSELSYNDLLARLRKCQPSIVSDKEVTFAKSPPACLKWAFRDKKVKLLKTETELIWQLSDKSTKTVSQAPFNAGFLCGVNAELPSCKEVFEDCEIEKLETESTQSLAHRLKAIYAKKIAGKSALDPSVPIDGFKWAVTLINSGTSSSDPKTWLGHAAIIIEGRVAGAFFTHKAHLRIIEDRPTVILQKNLKDDFTVTQKGETWIVNRSDVMRMLDAIQWEIDKQEVGDPQVLYSLAGSKSQLIEPKMIKEYSTFDDLVIEMLGIECLDPSLVPSTPIPFKSITLMDNKGKKWEMTNGQFETQGVEYDSPQKVFIQSPVDNKWRAYLFPDNCMTWAGDKIETWCKIDLVKSKFNALFAAPRRYMVPGIGVQQGKVLSTDFRRYRQRTRTQEEDKELTPLMKAILDEDSVETVTNLLPKPKGSLFSSSCAWDEKKENKEEIAKEKMVKKKNNQGYNALHLACIEGRTSVVKYLIENRILDVNEESDDIYRSTPLRLAIIKEDESLVEYLLSKEAKIYRKTGTGVFWDSPLHILANSLFRINPKVAEILIQHFKINDKNSLGETPLITSARRKNIQMATMLLLNKALVDEEDREGRTALWHACHNGDKEMVLLLIAHHTDLSAQNKFEKYNPFKEAQQNNQWEILDIMFNPSPKQQTQTPNNSHCLVS